MPLCCARSDSSWFIVVEYSVTGRLEVDLSWGSARSELAGAVSVASGAGDHGGPRERAKSSCSSYPEGGIKGPCPARIPVSICIVLSFVISRAESRRLVRPECQSLRSTASPLAEVVCRSESACTSSAPAPIRRATSPRSPFERRFHVGDQLLGELPRSGGVEPSALARTDPLVLAKSDPPAVNRLPI